MSYTKEEALRLHEYSEGNQYGWLIRNGVIRDRYVSASQEILCSCGKEGIKRELESLADCAFRLRDELLKEYETPKGWAWSDCYRPIAHIIAPNNTCTHCGHDDRYFDWDAEAKPIHWIQAALLAKIERGE